MDAGRTAPAGIAYPRLVPASLLPPEDPAAGSHRRTARDLTVDISIIVLAALSALLFVVGNQGTRSHPTPDGVLVVDAVVSGLGVVALWWRRRWPVALGVVSAALSVFSAGIAAVGIFALFTVAVHRRTGTAIMVGAVGVVAGAIFPLVRHQDLAYLWAIVISVTSTAMLVAWGMFVRARRQLVWTLRERAERAETEQQMQADRARAAERTRIAREMHDVLAHRISLLALHAGGLAMRPDLPAQEVGATAELLRSTAQRALEELRGVIGVLRDESAGAEPPSAPQPTLSDLPRLVDDTRRAGAKIDFEMTVPEAAEPPGSVGRDAYRIVQEALTNVAKHAQGTATSVRVSGGPGGGLHVAVRNRLPVHAGGPVLPGSGSGLLGLRERVTLAGGTIDHGPTPDGEFVVDARLAWS